MGGIGRRHVEDRGIVNESAREEGKKGEYR